MLQTSSAGRKFTVVDYTSEKEIRTAIAASNQRRSPLPSRVFATWAERVIERTRKAGRLMTDVQLKDFRSKRSFRIGDRVVHLTQVEEHLDSGTVHIRPRGQTGIISHIKEGPFGLIFTFHPDGGPTDQVVDLVVLEYTPRWLCLERIV